MINKKTISIFSFVILLLLCICATVSTLQGCKNGLQSSKDFSHLWTSAKLILNGENPYDIALKKKSSKYLSNILRNKKIGFDSQYLPSSLLFILPYAILPFDVAVKLFLITNLIFTGLLFCTLFLIISPKLYSKWYYLFIVMVFLCGTPFRNTLGLGQLSIISLAFFVLALHFDDKKQWIIAGIFLSCYSFLFSRKDGVL